MNFTLFATESETWMYFKWLFWLACEIELIRYAVGFWLGTDYINCSIGSIEAIKIHPYKQSPPYSFEEN